MNSIIGILVNGENKTTKNKQISENYILKFQFYYLTVRKDEYINLLLFICRTQNVESMEKIGTQQTRPIFRIFPNFKIFRQVGII